MKLLLAKLSVWGQQRLEVHTQQVWFKNN